VISCCGPLNRQTTNFHFFLKTCKITFILKTKPEK